MKIVAALFEGFTPIDLIGPTNCWGFIPGVDIQLTAHEPGPVAGDFGAQIVATHSFETCHQEPDVLLVPGAAIGVFRTLQDDRYLDHIARLGSKAGWVTSVCNGSLLLGAASLLEGYRAACYWYSRDYLRLFGAEPVNERVVIDRNRATGGGMTAGVDFGIAMMGQWQGTEAGQLIELCVEYAPAPPYGTGRPELAPPEILARAEQFLSTQMPNDLVVSAAERRGFK